MLTLGGDGKLCLSGSLEIRSGFDSILPSTGEERNKFSRPYKSLRFGLGVELTLFSTVSILLLALSGFSLLRTYLLLVFKTSLGTGAKIH